MSNTLAAAKAYSARQRQKTRAARAAEDAAHDKGVLTKRVYELLAQLVVEMPDTLCTTNAAKMWFTLELAKRLHKESPNFRIERFYKACGLADIALANYRDQMMLADSNGNASQENVS